MPSVAEAQGGANGKGDPTGPSKATTTQVEVNSKELVAQNKRSRENLGIKLLPESISIPPTKNNTKIFTVENPEDTEAILAKFVGDQILLKCKNLDNQMGIDRIRRVSTQTVYKICAVLSFSNGEYKHRSYFNSSGGPDRLKKGDCVVLCTDLAEYLIGLDPSKLDEQTLHTLIKELGFVTRSREVRLTDLSTGFFFAVYFKANTNKYYTPKNGETFDLIVQRLIERDITPMDIKSIKEQGLYDKVYDLVYVSLARVNSLVKFDNLEKVGVAIDPSKSLLIPRLNFTSANVRDFLLGPGVVRLTNDVLD